MKKTGKGKEIYNSLGLSLSSIVPVVVHDRDKERLIQNDRILSDNQEGKIILEDEDGKPLERVENEHENKNFDQSNVWEDTKDLLLFGGLNSGAAIIGATSDFISAKFIADYDQNLLAASGLISALQNFVYYVPSGCLCFTAILLNAKMAPNADKSEIGRITRQSWVLSTIMSIPATLLTVFSGDILKAFHQDHEAADFAQEYFRAAAYGVPAYFLMVCNTQIGMGLQKPKVIFLTFLAQRGLLLSLGYLLMFGTPQHFPRLGIAGLGYANSISTCTALLGSALYISYLSKKEPLYKIFHCDSSKGWGALKEIVTFGGPTSIKIGIALASTQLIVWMSGWFGNDELTSCQISLLYMSLLTLPATDLGQASGVLISHALATNNIAKARRLANICCTLSAVAPTIAMTLFFATPRSLIGFFINEQDPKNQAIVSTTTHLLWLTAGGIFDSVQFAYEGSLRGFNDTKFAMFSGLINNLLLAVPLALLAYFDNISSGSEERGMCGIFAARMGCMVACAASLCMRWFYRSSTYRSDTTASNISGGSSEQPPVASRSEPQSCWSWLTSFFRPKRNQPITPLITSSQTGSPKLSDNHKQYGAILATH